MFVYSAALAGEGKNKEGEEYLRKAIALEPRNARFEYHLGSLLVQENRPSEARQAFERSIELGPDYAPPRYQLGKLLLEDHQPQAACRELKLAIRYQPGLAQAYYQLARASAQLGETAESKQALAQFNDLKKLDTTADQGFVEDIRRQLQSALE